MYFQYYDWNKPADLLQVYTSTAVAKYLYVIHVNHIIVQFQLDVCVCVCVCVRVYVCEREQASKKDKWGYTDTHTYTPTYIYTYIHTYIQRDKQTDN